jgi:diaminopimelate epimerase
MQIGYARVGVPHLVVRCENVERVDVVRRGRQLRRLPQLRDGANANFVSMDEAGGQWRMRTYERGVEDETLACGTGTVATAALLKAWEAAPDGVQLVTRSGLILFATGGDKGRAPVLRGEGRIVFTGEIAELPLTAKREAPDASQIVY